MKLFVEPERKRDPRSLRLWLGLAVSLLLAVIAGCEGLFISLRYWWELPLALLLGHFCFAFSRMVTTLSLKAGIKSFVATLKFFYRPYGGLTLLFYFILSISEELFFRALPLSLIDGTWWQVVLLSMGFAAVHLYPPRKKPFPVILLVDFFLMGIGLSLLFLWLGDLWPLVIVHWVRNGSVAKVLIRRDRLERVKREEEESKAQN